MGIIFINVIYIIEITLLLIYTLECINTQYNK